MTEARGSLPGAGFRTAGPEHGYSTPPATTPIDRWLPQAVEALEEKATDHPFWKLWTPTDVGASDSVRIFGAENRELRLSGRSEEYPGHDPFSTVRWFTDPLGRWISNGPRWSWYTDSGTFLAVSDLRLTSLPETRASGSASPLSPLATAATVIGNAPADFLAGMRWRLGDEPLYWFTDRPPQEVFTQGAMPKGHGFASLLEYVYHGRDNTVWMSATRNSSLIAEGLDQNPAQAGAAAGRYIWRYELRVPGGVDVNATLDFASPYPFEREIAFPGGVHPRFVHSAVDLRSSGADGRPTTVVNPDFAPGDINGDPGAQETVGLWRERREGGQAPSDGLGLSTAEARLEPARREVVTAANGLTVWARQALSTRPEGFAPRSGLLGGAPQPPPGFFSSWSSDPTDHGPPAPLTGSTGPIGRSIWGPSATGPSPAWPANSFAPAAGPSTFNPR
ncbi:scabin-related ADP-ribosyltransferase, partial [Streptomyces nigra]